MNTWTDLMIDLETAGHPPNGAIMSIGAAFFNLSDCTIGPTFKRNIQLATAVRDGGEMDPATMLWWMQQGDEARRSVIFDTYDNRKVLTEFRAFVNEHSREQDVRPWGNGASFDLTLLGAAYTRVDENAPWRFFNERCFRTVRNMYPAIEYNPDDKGAGAHNALTDAIFQAQHLFKIKNRNKPNA